MWLSRRLCAHPPLAVQDIHIIENELILADLASTEKRVGKKGTKAAMAGWNSDAEAKIAIELLSDSYKLLQEGRPVRSIVPTLNPTEQDIMRRLQLLTAKPVRSWLLPSVCMQMMQGVFL